MIVHRTQRRIMLRSLLLVLVAALCVTIGLVWMRADAAKAPSARKPAPAISVQMATVEPQSFEFASIGLGTVQAWNTATITPQVSGQVVELPFQEGALVQKGDVLLRIDARPFQAVLDQAIAKKAQDDAILANLQKNLGRDQTLLTKGGFATRQTVDNEQAQVDEAKATVASDLAAIETAQLNVDYATIRAPFTGVVGLRNIDLGNVVSPTSNIVTITEIEPIAVDFTLPQSDLNAVHAAAQAKSPAYAFDQSGVELLSRGTLEVVNNQVDPATGTIKLKARFDNKDQKLWPGAFVQVRVITKTETKAIVVASQAVQRGPDGPFVWLVSPDQIARLQPVKIEAFQDDRIVIADGLTAGDRVVIQGQYGLTQGVRVTEAAPLRQAPPQVSGS